jgi:hypothetical protein
MRVPTPLRFTHESSANVASMRCCGERSIEPGHSFVAGDTRLPSGYCREPSAFLPDREHRTLPPGRRCDWASSN